MSVLKALAWGIRRMIAAFVVVLVTWLSVLLFALPGAVIMEELIREDIGASLIHEHLREGLELGWLEEFHHRQGGLARTLTPSAVSSVAAFDNLEAWFSGSWFTRHQGLAAAAIMFLFFWFFLQGGILSQLAQPGRPFAMGSFMGDGGSYFFRFVRLGLLSGTAYYGIYRLACWLFPKIGRITQDVTVEKTALAYHLSGALVIVLMMAVVRLIADYARIATIRERRRSMLLAVLRSLRQVARHPLQALSVLAVLSAMLLLFQGVYSWLAPDVTDRTVVGLLVAVGIGQVYLILRWALRVTLYGAEISLFDEWTGRSVPRSGRYVG